MFTSTRKTRIEWGDCDPAGIIFFARYFDMFDVSTTVLIERALGMKKIEYLKAYKFSGHPLVQTRARFLLPTRFGDEVKIETRLTHDGALAVEGFETRVWVGRDPADPRRIKSQPIPPQIVGRLTHASLVSSR